jgi:hypothetical protein
VAQYYSVQKLADRVLAHLGLAAATEASRDKRAAA